MENKRKMPAPGEFYRHFKNKMYQIVTVAVHSETGEELVIYQALYGDYRVYARPLSMFMSEVDHDKYPQVQERYRFEKVCLQNPTDDPADNSSEEIQRTTGETKTEEPVNPLMEFLDAEGHQERLNVLIKYKEILTEVMMDSMGASMDCVLSAQGTEEKYYELEKILRTKIQYEKKPR